MTDLEEHILATPLVDTHEHQKTEKEYVENGPDILCDLFDNYVLADLVVAGAPREAVARLTKKDDPDIAGRFEGVRDAWERCSHTGYGEAIRLIARLAYGMAEITTESIVAASEHTAARRKPGERRRILQEAANLDHVQIDDFCWPCAPDPGGVEFFLRDLSWVSFCAGQLDPAAIHAETGIDVRGIDSLDEAMAAVFARHAPTAIAVKTQHAYNRTLRWRERSASEAGAALGRVLAGGDVAEDDRLCLGDWCWARGVELAIEHNLPFKMHTGYYAGEGGMPLERITPSLLCPLLKRYPNARFVLMHGSYPYGDELVALAKHYQNVYADLCWNWAIDPYRSGDVLRAMIHAAPANKLFAFGGDTFWPNATLAYAAQARQWIARALDAEVSEGLLTEREAMRYATRIMRENQYACFDVDGTRAALCATKPA